MNKYKIERGRLSSNGGDDMKGFAIRYEDFYSMYNCGKSHKQRQHNKTLGKKRMRNKLKREMNKQTEDY